MSCSTISSISKLIILHVILIVNEMIANLHRFIVTNILLLFFVDKTIWIFVCYLTIYSFTKITIRTFVFTLSISFYKGSLIMYLHIQFLKFNWLCDFHSIIRRTVGCIFFDV